MDKDKKEKIIKLGTLMNEKSLIHVPLIKPIIECYEIMFNDEEIDFLLSLKDKKYTKASLRELSKFNNKEYEDFIFEILNKGAIWCINDEYELAPIFPGWIEICLSGDMDEKREKLGKKFIEFEDFLSSINIPPVRAYLNYKNSKRAKIEQGRMSTYVSNKNIKTVEINKKLESKNGVTISGEIYSLLKRNKENIAVMNCFCRLLKKIDKKECEYNMPMKTCLSVGSFSNQIVDYGVGEKISYEQACNIIEKCEEKGAIHTIYHYGINSENEEICICNCCKDCCALYGAYNNKSISNIFVKAYYIPIYENEENCKYCGLCEKFCPTGAVKVDKENKRILFDESKCIGCGQCVSKCHFNVKKMIRNERNVFVKTLPKNKV